MCVGVSVCVRSGPASQTSLKWETRDPLHFWALNANSSKMVKARDFKFDKRVSRDSTDMTP